MREESNTAVLQRARASQARKIAERAGATTPEEITAARSAYYRRIVLERWDQVKKNSKKIADSLMPQSESASLHSCRGSSSSSKHQKRSPATEKK